jgi:protein-S-isoprenylcysteine O-methyltransferase Ste14
MLTPAPISFLQYGLTCASFIAFAVAVFLQRRTMPRTRERAAVRSRLSIAGIAIQGSSFFFACFGRIHFALENFSPPSLANSAAVVILGFGGVLLFVASARALGQNWSLVARMRTDHGLVSHGPFARVRHPIYLAMLLLLIAASIGFGHASQLIAAIPVFVIGTAIRIREEERLLRGQFGDEYVRYANETPAFIPRLKL